MLNILFSAALLISSCETISMNHNHRNGDDGLWQVAHCMLHCCLLTVGSGFLYFSHPAPSSTLQANAENQMIRCEVGYYRGQVEATGIRNITFEANYKGMCKYLNENAKNSLKSRIHNEDMQDFYHEDQEFHHTDCGAGYCLGLTDVSPFSNKTANNKVLKKSAQWCNSLLKKRAAVKNQHMKRD